MFDSIPTRDGRAVRLALAVRVLDQRYRGLRQDAADEAGVSMAELDALLAVAETPRITPKALAAVTHLTTSATTAQLDRLTAAGLVVREPHPTDRRSLIVALTPVAERLIRTMYTHYLARFDDLLAAEPCVSTRLDELLMALGHLSDTLAPQAPDRTAERARALSA